LALSWPPLPDVPGHRDPAVRPKRALSDAAVGRQAIRRCARRPLPGQSSRPSAELPVQPPLASPRAKTFGWFGGFALVAAAGEKIQHFQGL